MATIDPLVKRLKKSKKKKIQFEIPEEHINQSENEVPEENKPLINVSEFENNSNVNGNTESTPIIINNSPSAPPEEDYVPTGLQNDKMRRKFIQKVYGALMVHMTTCCILIALFVYIPHLRKVFRKWIFDPLFLSSIIGIPLCVSLVLLCIFPSIRRRFAFITMIIITASLSFLISYAITEKTANAFMYSIGSSDLCLAGAVGASSSKRVDFTKWRYILTIPLFMIGSSVLAPTILNTSFNYTIWPSILMTALMTYLGANTRPVIKYNDLNIEPHEYLFAATQLYLNPEQSIKHRLGEWICGRRERNRNDAVVGSYGAI